MKHAKIISDWDRALRSYSFWFAVLGSLTFVIPYLSWELFELDLDPNLFGWAGFGFTLLALIGRFIVQPASVLGNALRIGILSLFVLAIAVGITNASPPSSAPLAPQAQTSEARIMAVALPFLKRWEGVKLRAYRDVVGIWTICSGTTRGVTPGMQMSAEECDELLRKEALEYWRGVSVFLKSHVLQTLTDERGASWTSFAINVGIRAAGKSTATKRLNQGDLVGACEALTWWNKAGGKIYRGLVNRRTAEYDLCMVGVQT